MVLLILCVPCLNGFSTLLLCPYHSALRFKFKLLQYSPLCTSDSRMPQLYPSHQRAVLVSSVILRSAGADGTGADEAARPGGTEEGDEERVLFGYVSILRETVNRGCDLDKLGRVYGGYKKRKLNIEHVVPRAVILAAVGNASDATAPATNDLFNMFLAVPILNRARRDYKFCAAPFGSAAKPRPTLMYGKINSPKRKYSENARDVWWSLGDGLFVNDRLSRFVPRPEDRGLIGRTILHMVCSFLYMHVCECEYVCVCVCECVCACVSMWMI